MAGLLDNILGKPYTLGELMKVDQGRQDRAAKCAVRLDDTFYTLKEETPLSKFKNLFTKNTLKVFYVTLKLAVTSDTGNTHYGLKTVSRFTVTVRILCIEVHISWISAIHSLRTSGLEVP